MCVAGLYYMAVPGGIAVYGLKKSGDELKNIERYMLEHNITPRNRDRLVSLCRGTVEKLTISALTLGHSEAFFLDGQLGLGGNLGGITHEVLDHNASAGFNGMVNIPVDMAKDFVDYADGDPFSFEAVAVIGTTAAVVEHATNRAGSAGRNWQTKRATCESQQAMMQGFGARRR
jgi:hypothetical protein